MKNLCFFWWLFLQNKNCWHSDLLMNQIFGQRFSHFKNGGKGVNYWWNYGLSKLQIHFFEHRLDQLNNKHTKTAAVKWRPYNISSKLNEHYLLMANIFKLYKYIFSFLEIGNTSKIWFANYKFVGNKVSKLKTSVSRKQSTPNFPENEHFLPPDTHT